MNSAEVRSRVRNLKFTNIQFKLKIKHFSFLSTMKSALQLAGSSSDTMSSSSSSAPLFCSFPPPPPRFLHFANSWRYWTNMGACGFDSIWEQTAGLFLPTDSPKTWWITSSSWSLDRRTGIWDGLGFGNNVWHWVLALWAGLLKCVCFIWSLQFGSGCNLFFTTVQLLEVLVVQALMTSITNYEQSFTIRSGCYIRSLGDKKQCCFQMSWIVLDFGIDNVWWHLLALKLACLHMDKSGEEIITRMGWFVDGPVEKICECVTNISH